MKEEELLGAQQMHEVVCVFQSATRHLFDPDALLKVQISSEKIFLFSTFGVGKRILDCAEVGMFLMTGCI